jgi:hypothetical protein
MIFEILSVYFLIQSINLVIRLIGRRRDVLYYVSKLHPD